MSAVTIPLDFFKDQRSASEFRCIICMGIPWPDFACVYSKCGGVICRTCFNAWNKAHPSCPKCRENSESCEFMKESNHFAYSLHGKQLLECPWNCGWTGELSELQTHMKKCDNGKSCCKFRRVGCEFMGSVLEMDEHMKREDYHAQLVMNYREDFREEVAKSLQPQTGLNEPKPAENGATASTREALDAVNYVKSEILKKFFSVQVNHPQTTNASSYTQRSPAPAVSRTPTPAKKPSRLKNKAKTKKEIKEERKLRKEAKKGKPKKPLSAFFCYQSTRRPDITHVYPRLCNKEIVSKMSEEWRRMDEKQKEPYVRLAEKDCERYRKEKTSYDEKKRASAIEQKGGQSSGDAVQRDGPW